METKILQVLKTFVYRGSGAKTHSFRSMAVLFALLTLGIGNAWAGGGSSDANSYAAIMSDNTAQGLVYMKKQDSGTPSDPALSAYRHYSPTAAVNGNSNYTKLGSYSTSVAENAYFWAMPARGYEWKEWSGYGTGYVSTTFKSVNRNPESHRATWDGQGDVIHFANGGGSGTWTLITAKFKEATKYTITYLPSEGDGNYSVNYSYYKTKERSDGEYEFYTDNTTDDYSFTPTSESKGVYSYAADVVTLTATETTSGNFVGWFEGTSTTAKSTSKSYTYPVTQTTSVTAVFKLASLGVATGDLSPAVKALGSNNYTITVPVTAHGSWSAGDFTVAFAEQTSPARGDVTKGTVAYAQSSGNVLSSVGTLTIPFTYNPASWGNTDILVTVTPVYGTAVPFHILASATEPVTEEAQLWENGVKTQSGTLAAMVTAANALSTNPTVKLMQNKTIDAPLSLTKSMVFDLNDKTLTSTGTSAFSIAAQGIDVQIVDNGFSQLGTIAVSSSQSGNVSVVTFTQKAKLTMQGGTLSATNTGSGSAYGINVTQGSTFYMTNGQLTVTGVSEAQGVHVATGSDYATLNGGSITVTAPTNAYGVWSAGQSNVTSATIAAETTTGANAYGVYINGGVSTLTTNTVTATAKTTNAYAAYVNAGRLNGNGGTFAAEAVTSDVYGVYVAAGATAMLQMNAAVTAEATGVSGTSVYGVNNLGTVSLTNVSVTATSPTTAATAVNIASGATATTIEGGTYRANGNGSSYGLHHQAGSLNVDGGDFKAIGSGSTIYGGRSTVNAIIANASIWGETQGSGNTAYGFVAATEGKNISLTNCTIKGISATSKAYAIYSRANVTATNCDLTATTNGTNYAYGVYAENGTNSIVNTNATVYSNTTYAYGVYHKAGSLSMEGGTFDVEAMQAGATSVAQAYLYGLYNEANMTTTINNTEFNVLPASGNSHSQYVYGAYINGTLISSGATYSAEGYTYVYGIFGNSASTLTLSNNTIGTNATNSSYSYGVYAKKNFTIDGDIVSAHAYAKYVYALYFEASTSDGDVLTGKFSAVGNGTDAFGPLNDAGTVGKIRLQGGVYTTMTNLQKYTVTGYDVFNLDGTHVEYSNGYRFIIATENPSPYVCYIVGGNYYTTLEAAMQYTKDNSGNYTIILTQDYTLPEGDYELPSNATLLVPRNADQASISGATPARRTTKSIIVENIRLTLASGAHINVNGKIEVGGEMYCAETGQICYVCSEYGRIHMEEGSLIQLNSGAVLYAWGYITGQGEIKVKNNAEVHEMFQIGDMKSMSNIGYYYHGNSEKFFLINQYSIQNIEVPTTYYYNSRCICAMASYYNANFMGDDNIKLVGTSGALFLVTTNDESSWVRKSYDAEHDYQVWDVNSKAQLGSMTINFEEGVPVIGSASFNSASYYLPITNNMKIHVLDGDFTITQTSELLPGASVEIDKTASFTIKSGKNVYVIDKDQWPFTIKQVVYSPSWKNGTKPTRTIADAAVNVHGKIVVNGGLFTSSSITDGTNATNGANIYSTNEDAGTVSYSTAATASSSVKWVTGLQGSGFSTSAVYKTISMESAKLKNNDGSYTATAETSSGEAFIYLDNVWQKTYTNGCFEVIGSTVYAKPSGYVALKKSQTVGGKLAGVEETNHTFLTADDKILILMDDCQWWEVVATSDPAVFECQKPGYEGFYYYDTTESKWKLKTVTVTFYQNETGSTVLKNIVTDYNGIPDQAVIATNPTKATTAEYTYSFYGWKSSVTGTEYKWTEELEVATDDMSYRPVFTATKRNYTITLVNANNGANVPLEVPYGDTPEYEPVKDATAQYTHTFEGWSPAFTTVTGTATYTATWSSVVNEYNITWKNGETVLEVDENQPYGTATAYNGTTPTKDADDDYAYTFSGWHNSLTNAPKANNETVTGAIIYTAQYNTTPRYAVTFNNYDGTQLDRIVYTQGQTPAYAGVPTRKRDDNGYFKFIGWKNSNGTDYAANAVLPTVTKKETYTAQYEYVTDLFTITLKNVDGNDATWSGKFGVGSTPFYDPDEDDVPDTPTKTGNAQYSYTFNGWSLTSGGDKLDPTPAVTEDATYWALFTQTVNTYTLTVASNNAEYGSVTHATVDAPYGSTVTTDNNTFTVNGTTVTANPTTQTAQYTYEFSEWQNLPATVTGNVANVQAVFTRSTRSYDITWLNDDNSLIEKTTVAYGEIPTHADATKTATAEYTYTFNGWDNTPVAVTGDATYKATFSSSKNSYEITWLNDDNSLIDKTTVEYGVVPTHADAIKAADATYTYTFNGWTPAIASVTGTATYTAVFTANPIAVLENLYVDDAKTLTGNTAALLTTIATSGKLNVPSGKILTTTDLILQGTTTTSGQLFTVDDNVTVTGDAYYDLTLNAQRRTWYGVAVPWRVSAQDGVYGDGKHLVLGKDFDIVWYDGETRAGSGPVAECYKYLENIGNPANRIIEPGRMYFMFFARPYNVIRFQKKADADLVNSGSVVTDRYAEGAADATNHGWNGIANPNLTHVTIPEATPNIGYQYMNLNIDENKTGQWQLVTNLSTKTLVVGQPIMVQLPADGGIKLTMSPVAYAAAPAPIRKMAANGDIDRAEVLLTSQNGATDRILCMVDDEAVDEYTIGQDLVKFTNDDVPQLWIRNYKHALAVNTVRAENNTATYPLTIVSPKAGDYTLSLVNKLADGIHLYLTLNGEAIADLTEGEYTLPMGKETNKAYGLRFVRGPRGTVTGVDEALDGKDNAEKVIMNGMLFIIRQGKMYDAQGRLIENR